MPVDPRTGEELPYTPAHSDFRSRQAANDPKDAREAQAFKDYPAEQSFGQDVSQFGSDIQRDTGAVVDKLKRSLSEFGFGANANARNQPEAVVSPFPPATDSPYTDFTNMLSIDPDLSGDALGLAGLGNGPPVTEQSFDEAFAAARREREATHPNDPGGGRFTWHGKPGMVFHTGLEGEGTTEAATTDTTNAFAPPYDIEASNEVATAAPADASLPPAERAATSAPISTQEVFEDQAQTESPALPTKEAAVAKEPTDTTASANAVSGPAGAEVVGDVAGGFVDTLSDLLLDIVQGGATIGQKAFTRGGPEQDAALRAREERFKAAKGASQGQLGKFLFDELEKVGGWKGLADYTGRAAGHTLDSFQQFFRPPPPPPITRTRIPPPVAPTTGGTQRTYSPTD